jgi:hypothetical protein
VKHSHQFHSNENPKLKHIGTRTVCGLPLPFAFPATISLLASAAAKDQFQINFSDRDRWHQLSKLIFGTSGCSVQALTFFKTLFGFSECAE